MLIKKKSVITGIERERDLDVTQEQFDAWENGVLIQEAFPNLSSDDREFIMTGIVQEEWETLNDEL